MRAEARAEKQREKERAAKKAAKKAAKETAKKSANSTGRANGALNGKKVNGLALRRKTKAAAAKGIAVKAASRRKGAGTKARQARAS